MNNIGEEICIIWNDTIVMKAESFQCNKPSLKKHTPGVCNSQSVVFHMFLGYQYGETGANDTLAC